MYNIYEVVKKYGYGGTPLGEDVNFLYQGYDFSEVEKSVDDWIKDHPIKDIESSKEEKLQDFHNQVVHEYKIGDPAVIMQVTHTHLVKRKKDVNGTHFMESISRIDTTLYLTYHKMNEEGVKAMYQMLIKQDRRIKNWMN